ncbi:MAG: hypothetical protein K2Y37_23595, partial [Pirellulales bacterium]|nr:hypothetical protein [Pirellulales bacterium]
SRNRSLREEPFFMEYQLPTISQKVQLREAHRPKIPLLPLVEQRDLGTMQAVGPHGQYPLLI